MTQWGRMAPESGAPLRPGGWRLGRLSLILAAIAFASALISFIVVINVSSNSSDAMETVGTAAFLIAFLVVAPALHIAGMICGFAALVRQGDSRGAGLAGLIANVVLLSAGVFLVWMAAGTIGAFT